MLHLECALIWMPTTITRLESFEQPPFKDQRLLTCHLSSILCSPFPNGYNRWRCIHALGLSGRHGINRTTTSRMASMTSVLIFVMDLMLLSRSAMGQTFKIGNWSTIENKM